MVIWWLGQAGFALQSGSSRILLDPYLSDSLARKYKNREFKHIRMMPPPCQPEDFSKLGRGTLYPCAFRPYGPRYVAGDCGEIAGMPFHFSPLGSRKSPRCRYPRRNVPSDLTSERPSVSAISNLKPYPPHIRNSRAIRRENSGISVISSVAESKSTIPAIAYRFQVKTELLRNRQIDVALLPVNGRDEYRASRGVPGNFYLYRGGRVMLRGRNRIYAPASLGYVRFQHHPGSGVGTTDRLDNYSQMHKTGTGKAVYNFPYSLFWNIYI